MASSNKTFSSYHSQLELEYTQTNDNFRKLIDIRFKLISFLPALGGVAIFALSFIGLSPQNSTFSPTDNHLWLVAAVSLLGFLSTLGIVFYDQRNSELYNALIHRAKYLENLFRSHNSPGARRKCPYGGQFLERPRRSKVLFGFIEMGHDTGLALIYGPILGAWFFPLTVACLKLGKVSEHIFILVAAIVALIGTTIFVLELIRIDMRDGKEWKKAGRHSIFVLVEKEDDGYKAWSPQFPNIVKNRKTAREAEDELHELLVQKRINWENEGKEIPEKTIYGVYI